MMAYYVASTGSNTSPYDTWAKAATALKTATDAATADGDIIYVDQGFTDTLSSSTTYTFSNNVRVICANDKINEPPQTLGSMGTSNWIGNSSTSYQINLTGAYKIFIYGLTFRIAGTGASSIIIGSTDGAHIELENCYFWLGTTSSSAIIGPSYASAASCYLKFNSCIFRFGSTGQTINAIFYIDFINCSISSNGSSPNVLFPLASRSAFVMCEGCDWSLVTTNLIASQTTNNSNYYFDNCKINASLSSVLATQTLANKGSATAFLFNSSGGDTHYHLQHHDAFGSTICDTGIYANDGASYDGTNRLSWKIVSTANCSYYTPYVSPWIDCYHAGTSAITPSLEICRSGSATAYQNDEVWGEFSYQGTSGFPLGITVNDRKALLAAAADQTTGALDASGWTGENATSWFGKLNPTAAITPAEIGHLRARVCVGEPSITVYVDPQIRGRS